MTPTKRLAQSKAAKWAPPEALGFQWPADWDVEGKCPTSRTRRVPHTNETRTWKALAGYCYRNGTRFAILMERLGGYSRFGRTLEQCHKEIRESYEKTGKRPTRSTSREFTNWDGWLLARDSSLRNECDKLGLPSLYNQGRSVSQCHREIRVYYKKTGKAPTAKTSEFKNWNNWLSKQGSSIRKECDKLGLPSTLNLDRDITQCHKEIRAHYKKTGTRPTDKTSKEFGNWHPWLRRRGSSLRKECDKLGLPSTLNLDRDITQCHKEIRAHYKKTGEAPARETSKEFNNWNQWLYRQDSSLSKECTKLGLRPIR